MKTFMKKIKTGLIFFILFAILFATSSVEAASTCDYATQVELSTQAYNVQATYEVRSVATGEMIEDDYPSVNEDGELETGYIEIYRTEIVTTIYNITKNIYVTVTNDLDGTTRTYHYEDTNNGTIEILRDNIDEIVNYEIKVYSDHEDCLDEQFGSTITLATPKYNDFSSYDVCEGLNVYYCEEYITQDLNMTYDQFIESATALAKENEEQNNPSDDEGSITSNIWFYIGIGVVIALVLAIIITLVIKRRGKVK